MDPYLTIREVNDLLKVSERTVRRWIAEGDLQALKIGRSVRVRSDDIDERLQYDREKPIDTEAQLAVLAKAHRLHQKMRCRLGDSPGNSIDILRNMRLERADVR